MTVTSFLSKHDPVAPQHIVDLGLHFGVPRVAIARAGAPLPMLAAKQGVAENLMTPVFVGEADAIRAEADKLDWDIGAYPLHDTTGAEEAGQTAARLCGTGEADVLMKGQIHSDVFLKAAVDRDSGLRTDQRLVHMFVISPPDGSKPMVISDAAVNIAPSVDVRKVILSEMSAMLQSLGTARPRLALLSATETPIDALPSSVEARELADWARTALPDADVSGPLALDLILSPDSVAIKGLDSDPVAGYADGIVVPDLVTGNALFKAFVYLGGGCAAGVITGAKVPILLTSRADPASARIASLAIANVMCGLPK